MPAAAQNIIKDKVQKLITLSFRDLILCLGGISMIHQMDDEVVRVITLGVEQIYEETLMNLKKLKLQSKDKESYPMAGIKPHPDIARFLSRLEPNNKKNKL